MPEGSKLNPVLSLTPGEIPGAVLSLLRLQLSAGLLGYSTSWTNISVSLLSGHFKEKVRKQNILCRSVEISESCSHEAHLAFSNAASIFPEQTKMV